MSDYLDLIFVGPQQAVPIIVALILWLGLAGLGTLVTNRDRLTEANVIFGWAVVSGIFTIVGVLIRAPFLYLAIALGVLAVIGIIRAIRSGQHLFIPGAWRVLVLALPLLWIAGAMEPSQWDEFSHWLPAPKYLLEINGFPTKERPYVGTHMLPAYPYAWPFLTYLSALIAGKLLTNVTSTLNIFLLLSFSTFALRTAFRISGKAMKNQISWSFATAVVIFATLLNPTFIQKIVLTAYSDVSTAVLTGYSVLLGYYFLDQLAEKKSENSYGSAWQLALALSLLINLRQANLVLVVVLLIAFSILALRDTDIRLFAYIKHLGITVFPIVIIYAVWRGYVGEHFGQLAGAEATLRPFDQWNFVHIPLILQNMLYVAGKKIGFFGPMIIACFFAIRGIVKFKTPFDRISILLACVFLGYTSFLFLTYLGHFQARTAISVVSFWRYSSHNGMVAVAFISIGVVYALRHRINLLEFPNWLKTVALVLVITLPFAFAHKLRFDLEPPKPHFTAVAKDLVKIFPKGSSLFVMDPTGNGESSKITYFHLNILGSGYLSAFHNTGRNNLKAVVDQRTDNSYMLIHSRKAGLSEAVGIKLSNEKSYLIRKEGARWVQVRDWQKPGNHKF